MDNDNKDDVAVSLGGTKPAEGPLEIESLFSSKPMPTRIVTFADGRQYLVQGVTHGEKDEIEQGHIDFEDDGTIKRDNTGKASEYVARGLRHPNGQKASVLTLPNGERVNSWKSLAMKVRDLMPPNEVDILYLAILDLSGLTKEHQDKILKGSGLTPTG